MIKLLRVIKGFISFISLVKMSAMLIFSSIVLIETVLFFTEYRMALSYIVMCLSPFAVIDLAQHTHALLSLNTCT